jgi:hypothetical protein
MNATVPSDEAQVACRFRFCVVASLNVPVATKTPCAPIGKAAGLGVTAIDTMVALLTVRLVMPILPPNDALTTVMPTPVPVTMPGVPKAAAPVLEPQVATPVTSWVRPSV